MGNRNGNNDGNNDGNKGKKAGESQAVVKRVNPYPIKGQVKALATGASIPIAIVKLTEIGYLAEVQPTSIQPGEKFECVFELPVSHFPVSSQVAFLKLYAQKGMHLVEMHFVSLPDEIRRRITAFLRAIHQT